MAQRPLGFSLCHHAFSSKEWLTKIKDNSASLHIISRSLSQQNSLCSSKLTPIRPKKKGENTELLFMY
jgi:hypothetical protein